MIRKFSELTPSEQIQFQGLVDFMKETWNEDFQVKLNIIKKFRLDPKDPVVYDFLTDIYIPVPPQPQISPIGTTSEQTIEPAEQPKQSFTVSEPSLPANTTTKKPIEKTKKREMTYANSEDLIIIQNRLLHAISHLTLNERRLILFLSPIVRQGTNIRDEYDREVFTVDFSEFANEYNLKVGSIYKTLKETAESVTNKAFFFWSIGKNQRKSKVGLSWFIRCEYKEKSGYLEIVLSNEVIEMLTIFDANTGNFWTQYQKEWVANLGTYGIVMLELVLSSFEREVKGYYTVEHLREKFNCVDNYSIFGDFKRFVIDRAIKEIEQHTPIKISYQTHKTGRAVTGLTFSYIDTSIKTVKDKTKNNDKPQEKSPFVNFKMTPKQLAVFGAKIAKNLNKDIEIVIDEMSNIHLQGQYIEYLKLLDFVPSDWYSDDEVKSHPTAEQIAQTQVEVEQERLKQEQAKKQVIDEKKRQEQQMVEQRHKHLAELFENLPPDEQEKALDEVEKFFKESLMLDWFKTARQQGIAHKDVRFIAKFYEYFDI